MYAMVSSMCTFQLLNTERHVGGDQTYENGAHEQCDSTFKNKTFD